MLRSLTLGLFIFTAFWNRLCGCWLLFSPWRRGPDFEAAIILG